jgi:hypothetical protein
MVAGMRRRQNPERMAALLSEREQRGWSWAELSQRSGLPERRLRWWHERFKRTPAARKPTPAFVAVEVTSSAHVKSGALEITTPSGHRITVPANFDAEHLRRVLLALTPPC